MRLALLHGFRFHIIEEFLAYYREHDAQNTVRAFKMAPNHADETREIVLKKLNRTVRGRYEIALKEFKTKNRFTNT